MSLNESICMAEQESGWAQRRRPLMKRYPGGSLRNFQSHIQPVDSITPRRLSHSHLHAEGLISLRRTKSI